MNDEARWAGVTGVAPGELGVGCRDSKYLRDVFREGNRPALRLHSDQCPLAVYVSYFLLMGAM